MQQWIEIGFLVLLFFGSVSGWLSWRKRVDQRLRTLEIRLEKLLLHVGFEASPTPPATDDFAVLARTPGAKVAAIKAYMRQTGTGLKEAKDEIERLAGDA